MIQSADVPVSFGEVPEPAPLVEIPPVVRVFAFLLTGVAVAGLVWAAVAPPEPRGAR